MVYILYHNRWIDEYYYDTKMIGIYSSKKKVQKIINKYLTLPGFSDYPNGFNLKFCQIRSKRIKNNTVYLLTGARFVDDDELSNYFGVYTNRLLPMLISLKNMLDKKSISQKYYIDKYRLDENHWEEGFVIL